VAEKQGIQVNNDPIFIGGLYKSGTSLLRAMLAQHSNIASGLETFWFDLQLNDSVHQNEQLGKEGLVRGRARNWDGTRHEPLLLQLKRLASFFGMDESKVLNIAISSHYPGEFLDKFMRAFASKEGKQRWAEKTPPNVLHMAEIFNYWPQAKFIYLIRDPRDVYSSLKRAGKYRDPHDFIHLWLHFTNAYHSSIQSEMIPSHNVLEVCYEDLACEPRATMKHVLEFCNEEWEEDVAEFQGKDDDFEKVRMETGKESSTLERLSKPLEKTRVGAWKRECSDFKSIEELSRIVASLGFLERWKLYCHQAAA
jgi:hypothetical protein